MPDINPRTLEIGFADYLSLQKRHDLMLSDMGIEDFRRIFKCNHSQEATQVLRWLEKDGKRMVISYGTRDFPDFTGLERNLPYFLFAEGTMPSAGIRMTAVGTRRTDWYGLTGSFRLGLELNLNGVILITGNAEGCDQALLNGALRGGCGNMVTVLPCGHDVVYPYYMDHLKEQILHAGGLVLSPFAPATPPLKHNFPNRNQILAAMGQFCTVVQAPLKSGALITADLATQMGKDVFVAACGLGDKVNRRGTQRLFDDGCRLLDEVYFPEIKVVESREKEKGIRFGNAYYEIIRPV